MFVLLVGLFNGFTSDLFAWFGIYVLGLRLFLNLVWYLCFGFPGFLVSGFAPVVLLIT